MCRNGGTSMTGLEQRISDHARLRARLAVSNQCWRACILLAILTASAQAAATGGDIVAAASSPAGSDATSSRAARDEAIRQIPWKFMSPGGRQTTQSVV